MNEKSVLRTQGVFSGFSVDDLATARTFYANTLGLDVKNEGVGLRLYLPDGGTVFIYPKGDHQPATFTILNFVVANIDAAVDALVARGVQFERYAEVPMDDKGIMRGLAHKMGPDIAWFKDPAGNILAVLQDA